MKERMLVDYGTVFPFLTDEDWHRVEPLARRALEDLESARGPGSDFLGWLKLPARVQPEEIRRIQEVSAEVRQEAEVFVVIGIGGSYLGARAVIEALGPSFPIVCSRNGRGRRVPWIVFAGHNLSAKYLEDLLEVIQSKSLYVNVISKSGTTTEPGLAFRLLRRHLVDKYGREGAARRILSTTDAARGALRRLSDQEGYRTFVIPDDVGGRYSVLTPVGLLPVAVAGISIEELLEGARSMMDVCSLRDMFQNPAALYAAGRNLLASKGYLTEILVTYEPRLQALAEWWKQLYGESEGKEGKGIFPASAIFTTDLHSLGQWIQQGPRTILETLVHIREEEGSLRVPEDPDAQDGLEYLAGKAWTEIQEKACAGTRIAHHQGGVPIFSIEVPRLNAYFLGQLLYFFEKACGVSGYLLGVNPFDQPGVEAYKQNVFALLGKPGSEERARQLEETMRNLPRNRFV